MAKTPLPEAIRGYSFLSILCIYGAYVKPNISVIYLLYFVGQL